jgi:hypothetical protein
MYSLVSRVKYDESKGKYIELLDAAISKKSGDPKPQIVIRSV